MVILYTVGIVGTWFESSRPLFLGLTPTFLLLNLGLLLLLQPGSRSIKFRIGLVAIFVLGWGIECIGVHTGVPFGNYNYGTVLGWKLYDVPLLIGVNWVLLTLAAAEWMQSVLHRNWLAAISASILLTALDGLIEPIAVKLGYWHWFGDQPPIQNYIAWFGMSLLMVLIWFWVFKPRRTDYTNPMAVIVLGLQFAFFIVLNAL
jgi:putative membrane protein